MSPLDRAQVLWLVVLAFFFTKAGAIGGLFCRVPVASRISLCLRFKINIKQKGGWGGTSTDNWSDQQRPHVTCHDGFMNFIVHFMLLFVSCTSPLFWLHELPLPLSLMN